jgi:hypothetical protein
MTDRAATCALRREVSITGSMRVKPTWGQPRSISADPPSGARTPALDDEITEGVNAAVPLGGLLAEKQFGRVRLFVNGENLTGVRQTRWDPMLRSTRAADGRWTVDAWAPLEGRNVNGGRRGPILMKLAVGADIRSGNVADGID